MTTTTAQQSAIARARVYWGATSASELRDNVVAGLVVGVIALPLSIALAVAVGVSPISGLYTATFAGAVAATFGGSRYNITGPTAALVPVLNHVVLRFGPGALPLVGFLAGVLLLLMSVFRFGRLVRYMPGVVVVGFTAGIALSIAFGQLNAFLAVSGTNPTLEYFHERLWDTVVHLGSVEATTPLLGVAAIAILLAWPRLLPRVPGPLIAVVVLTVGVAYFGMQTPTIASKYGELPRAFPVPSLRFFDLSLAISLVPSAFAVAVLAAVESLLSAVVADGMSSSTERHDPDRELRGQGLANLVAPIMGGIPATAAIARTAAGIRNGATARLTGVVHAVTVLTATMLLARFAGHIPLTVLAAILLIVAWNIAEVPEVVKLLGRAPFEDVVVLLSTLLITLFFDLTYAIGFGVLASAVLLIRRLITVPAAAELLPTDGGQIREVTPELSELLQSRPDIAFFNAGGALSFHSAAAFEYSLMGVDHRPLVLRMKDVHHIDTSGLLTLEGIIEHRHQHGARTMLTAMTPETYRVVERFGIIAQLGPGSVHTWTREAIDALDEERRVSDAALHR